MRRSWWPVLGQTRSAPRRNGIDKIRRDDPASQAQLFIGSVPISDLIQEGFCGLLLAIDRFDTANTTRLATYAGWWIRQAMQRTIADGAYPVHLHPKQLRRLMQALAQCPPIPAGLATAPPHFSRDRLVCTGRDLAVLRPRISLDARCRNDGSTPLSDLLATAWEPDEDEREAFEYLHNLLNVLKPRERVVLRLRFGLDGESRHSLSQVSQALAISKERVRQIQGRALQKLRVAVDERDGLGPGPAQPSIATPASHSPA
jgi:RNA polymerase primary sigma factor